MTSVLESAHLPAHWQFIPFGRLVARSKESGRPALQPLSVYLDDGVVPRHSRDDNYNRLGEDISKYLVVRQGDIVFNKLRTWQGGLGMSRHEGIVSPAYFVCRPGPRVDPRYLHYLLRSQPYLAEFTRISKFMPPSQFDIPWEDLRGVSVALPGIGEQRAIASYLDAETARIDALVSKKRRLEQRLTEHLAALIEEVVWRGHRLRSPLMHRTDNRRPIMYGIVLPGPDVPEGVPIVKGGDVATGSLSADRLCKTTVDIEAPYARARLRGGDLVFAIRGGIGDVRIVPSSITGANITQDVARVSHASDVDPRWLLLALRSASVQGEVMQRTTGATVRGLNIWDLKRVGVPSSDSARQAEDLGKLLPALGRQDRMSNALRRQLALLREHRQALITAAVTGELAVPGAA